jgi:putative Holliday junction resolvase
MGRILAFDYGNKRIGLAVTDPLQIIASPLNTIGTSEIENFLHDYLKMEIVDEFVVGYPVLFPGKPIHLIDERFTSKIALRTIIDGGVKKKDRRDKKLADKISASLILQSFLEKREFSKGKENKK